MKVTTDNINNLSISEYEKSLLNSLLVDVEKINGRSKVPLYINFIDVHTEYSPERTDPCPDYYGMYTIKHVNNPYESIGVEMTINELDTTLCALYNYIIDI